MIKINPELDGIDHINIYSKGKTDLGKWLSNFTFSPFTCEDGNFNSIEGYWYWLSSHNDKLRTLSGFEAKKVGRLCDRVITDPNFEDKIKRACWIKLHSNVDMYNRFKLSTLPFTHYYVFGTKVQPAGFEWITEMWEYFRIHINVQK